MIDQIYPYIIQVAQALIRAGRVPVGTTPEDLQLSDNWQHVDTQELVITREVSFLFEYRIVFLQIEVKTIDGQVTAINTITDPVKRISYQKL